MFCLNLTYGRAFFFFFCSLELRPEYKLSHVHNLMLEVASEEVVKMQA